LVKKYRAEDKPALALALAEVIEKGDVTLVPEDNLDEIQNCLIERMLKIQEAIVIHLRHDQVAGSHHHWFSASRHNQEKALVASNMLDRLKKLHELYLKSTVIIDILYEVDTMLSIGGWIPILTRAFDLGALFEYVKLLHRSDERLNNAKEMERQFSLHKHSPAYKGYLKHHIKVCSEQSSIKAMNNTITLLYSAEVRDFVVRTFAQSMNGVLQCQSRLMKHFEPLFLSEKKTAPSLVNPDNFELFGLKGMMVHTIPQVVDAEEEAEDVEVAEKLKVTI
jgi:hypothetical protein